MEAAPDLVGMILPASKIYLGRRRRPAVVRTIARHGQFYLLRLEGVEDRDAAEKHRGGDVYLRQSEIPALPRGTYYHWQIVGLEVLTEEGEDLGSVTEILQTGANDVYVVRAEHGGEILLPAIESVVRDVDLESRTMHVRLLPGLRGEPEG
jgi:16S rRNA processing protein RimM